MNWIIPEDSGTTILGYVDTYGLSPSTLLKIDPEGNRVWYTRGPEPSEVTMANTSGGFGAGNRLISDGAGGVFILWKDILSRSGSDSSLFMQCIDSQGNIMSNESEWEITDAAYRPFLYEAIPDGSGGLVIAWTIEIKETQYHNVDYLVAQRMDKIGNKLWSDSGIRLTPIINMNDSPLITADNSGGFIITIGAGASIIIDIRADGEIAWKSKF